MDGTWMECLCEYNGFLMGVYRASLDSERQAWIMTMSVIEWSGEVSGLDNDFHITRKRSEGISSQGI